MIRSALVLPTPPALVPPFSRVDPVGDLRKECTKAVEELLASRPERVWVIAPPVSLANRARGVSVPLGHRVARHLLEGAGQDAPSLHEVEATTTAAEELRSADGAVLVMADGSATRHEEAPGHLHPDAVGFDASLEQALLAGDAEALAQLDLSHAEELWCEGGPALRVLGEVARGRAVQARVTYADAPYGVAWWVAHWALG